MVGSQRTADVFPVVASLREVTPGNMSAVGRLYVGGKVGNPTIQRSLKFGDF